MPGGRGHLFSPDDSVQPAVDLNLSRGLIAYILPSESSRSARLQGTQAGVQKGEMTGIR